MFKGNRIKKVYIRNQGKVEFIKLHPDLAKGQLNILNAKSADNCGKGYRKILMLQANLHMRLKNGKRFVHMYVCIF